LNLKRFTAPDIKMAISQVREELGPDAVIISNRKTENGVEIIAAMDYDASAADSWESMPIENVPVTRSNMRSSNSYLAQRKSGNAVKSLASRIAERAKKRDDEPMDFLGQMDAYDPYDPYDDDMPDPLAEPPPPPPEHTKVQQEQSHQSTVDWLNKLRGMVPTDSEQGDVPQNMPPVAAAPLASSSNEENKEMMASMWSELQTLRGLLERQLSSIAWGDIAKRYPQKAMATRKLLELGLSPVTVKRLLDDVKEYNKFDEVWKKALASFANKLPTTQDDIVMKGGVFALVGPTGVGKTTTLAKMAARYAIKHGTKDIALITTDNYRVGAQEQLKTYGRIMDVPVRVVNNAHELRRTLKTFVDKKLILIDTAGMSQRDVRLMEQIQLLSEGSSLIQSYLVMSAATQLEVLDETIKTYQKAVLDGCIITKIDETHSLGGILSVVAHYQLPIAYTSNGQRVPEDLHMESSVELIKAGIALMQKHPRKVENEAVELVFGGAAKHGSI